MSCSVPLMRENILSCPRLVPLDSCPPILTLSVVSFHSVSGACPHPVEVLSPELCVKHFSLDPNNTRTIYGYLRDTTLELFDSKISVGENANLAGDAHGLYGQILGGQLRMLQKRTSSSESIRAARPDGHKTVVGSITSPVPESMKVPLVSATISSASRWRS